MICQNVALIEGSLTIFNCYLSSMRQHCYATSSASETQTQSDQDKKIFFKSDHVIRAAYNDDSQSKYFIIGFKLQFH